MSSRVKVKFKAISVQQAKAGTELGKNLYWWMGGGGGCGCLNVKIVIGFGPSLGLGLLLEAKPINSVQRS